MQIVNLRLLHDLSAGDQLAEALLVGKGVAGANTASTSVGAALSPDVRVVGLREGFLAEEALLHSTAVTERRVDGERVEAAGDDGKEEDDEDDEKGEPELATGEGHAKAAQVLVVDEVAVDEERQRKVEGNRAPDDNVVENRPVGGVQGNLKKVNGQ